MPLTYPSVIHPNQQRFLFTVEDGTYGVPGNAAGKTFLETVTSISTAIQRTPYEGREMVGVPGDIFDMIETTHHSTVTVSGPWRANGMGAWALAAIMGAGASSGAGAGYAADTSTAPSGTAPALNFAAFPAATFGASTAHYITPNNANNVCNTFTIWHDAGDGQFTSGQRGLLQMSAATVETIRLTFTPGSACTFEATFQANFPQFRGVSGSAGAQNAPATYTKLASDPSYRATRMMGYQGVSTNFKLSTATDTGTNRFTLNNKVLSGELTLTRTAEIIETPFQQNPIYFVPGPLAITGTFDMLFDGLGDLTGTGTTTGAPANYTVTTAANYGTPVGNTIYQEYLNFSRVGSGYNPNEIRYIDTDGNGFGLQFFPIKWTSFAPTASGQSLKVNAGFTSFNDLSLAVPQSGQPRLSAIAVVGIQNNVSVPMVV